MALAITWSSAAGSGWIEARRRGGITVQDRVEDQRGGPAGERPATGGHLVDRRRQARRGRCARRAAHPYLLRRHVGRPCRRRRPGSSAARWTPVSVVPSPPTPSAFALRSILARPKSRIFASPRAQRKMFAGVISRWTMPARWAESRHRPPATPGGGRGRSRVDRPPSAARSVCPSRSSMTRNGAPSWVPDVVERADVRVVERRCRPRLALEAGTTVGVGLDVGGSTLISYAERNGGSVSGWLRELTPRSSRARNAAAGRARGPPTDRSSPGRGW